MFRLASKYFRRAATAIPASQLRHNKALHPTAYSFVPYARASLRSLRFRRRVSLVVRRLRLLNRGVWLEYSGRWYVTA